MKHFRLQRKHKSAAYNQLGPQRGQLGPVPPCQLRQVQPESQLVQSADLWEWWEAAKRPHLLPRHKPPTQQIHHMMPVKYYSLWFTFPHNPSLDGGSPWRRGSQDIQSMNNINNWELKDATVASSVMQSLCTHTLLSIPPRLSPTHTSEVDLINRISVHACDNDMEEVDTFFIWGLYMSGSDAALDKKPWLL